MKHTARPGGPKRAVMFGAGNIGRGFIGQLFDMWGFHTTFVEIDPVLVEQINLRHAYPIHLLHADREETYLVQNVRAISGLDASAVATAVEGADIVAVSVGARALPSVMDTLAGGLVLRIWRNAPPLNLLICENLMGAQAYVRGLLLDRLPIGMGAALDETIGLIETSIGRMIPVLTPEMKAQDPLQIYAESYCELPVDKAAFKGEVPDYPGLQPREPFSFYIKRKMLIHNMGHSMAAYLGYNREYTYIWEAMEDAFIRHAVREAMLESAEALGKEYAQDTEALHAYVEDLLIRFSNRKLGDTVARVGRDLPRKLGENERMFAAARLCGDQGAEDDYIRRGIQAALFFREDGSPVPLGILRSMADLVVGYAE